MAEAFINQYGEGTLIAESAGFEPGQLSHNVL